MPWSTPSLKQVRILVRDSVRAYLPGADACIPNSVLRVVSDNQGAMCHLTLQYLDWLSLQLLPDTAETTFLDRHANIWLINADGSIGRKPPTLAVGTVTVTGVNGAILPIGQQMTAAGINGAAYETVEQAVLENEVPTMVLVRALDPGTIGNQTEGATLALFNQPLNVDSTATVVELLNGTDQETDDELRARILERIQKPPMGGDADDFVEWTLSYPGVTRAWCYPLEMGIGTVSVRFMMDDLRADNDGFPLPVDVANVTNYLNTVRPVAIKDFFCEAPIPYPVNVHITWLDPDNAAARNAITASLVDVFMLRTSPGQTWYRAWTDQAIINAVGVNAYDLDATDAVMPSPGYMPICGDITYG